MIGYLPCRECGLLLSSEQRPCHVCNPEDSVAHQVTKVRVQLTAFESEVARFLETSAGKFAVFLAERQRRT
jgi:RNA polymerase subunit RPABC4/transcription elongation factor Spt4